MTTIPTLHPGQYNIKRFEIVGRDGNNIDITGIVPELHIEESMDQNCIRGRAVLIDKASLLESLPLRGEERLIIQVEDAEKFSHTYDMFLYKISDVIIADSNDGLSYTIHFCSFARYVAGLSRVCKAYDTYIHEMVRDVFRSTYSITENGFSLPNGVTDAKLSEPSVTESIQHLVIPNMTAMQAIEFLSRRAYSEEYTSSSFRFFENTDGFHFLNDEDVLKRSPEAFRFNYSDAIDKRGLKFNELRRNLLDLSNPRRVNTMEDMNSGAYRNEVIEIDLIKKEVASKTFDVYERTQSANKLKDFSVDFHTPEFANQTFNAENARRFMTIKTNVADEAGSLSPNDNLAELISSKVSYRYHQERIQISALSHGRLDITCGNLVEILAFRNLVDRGGIEVNKQLSGTYIVRSVLRQFIRDNYRNVMLLTKVVSENTERPEITYTTGQSNGLI